MNTTLAQFIKPEVLVLLVVIIGLIVLAAKGKLPTVNSFVAFCNAINTRGGNIVLLTVMVFLFVTTSMKYIYFVIGLEVGGRLTGNDALALSGYSFITGAVTGLSIGAWLKALSPQDMPTPGSTTASTSSTVAAPEPPKEEVKS